MSKINALECFIGIEDHVALDRNPGPGNDILHFPLISHEIFRVHVPTYCPAFLTVGRHCQTPTITPACKAERWFVQFL